MSPDQIAALITTVVGALLGFSLSEVSTRRREAREEKRRAEGVRVIIRMEIDRNLLALKSFWTAVKASDRDDLGRRRKNVLAEHFVQVSLAPFSRESLSSQMSLLAASLSDVQIERVFHLYDQLDNLMTIRHALADGLRDEQQEMMRFRQSQSAPGQPQGLVYAPRTPFDSQANRDWDGIEATVAELLEAGNPLRPASSKDSGATSTTPGADTHAG